MRHTTSLITGLSTFAWILASATTVFGLEVATGSYIGNGAVGHAITDLQFRPDVVLIRGEAATHAVFTTDTLQIEGQLSKELGNAAPAQTNLVTQLDAAGFTVSNSVRVNHERNLSGTPSIIPHPFMMGCFARGTGYALLASRRSLLCGLAR